MNLAIKKGILPKAENGGLFVSPGFGKHCKRRIKTFEIILMRTGKLTMQEGDNVFTLNKNDTLILMPNRQHEGLSEYDANTSFYWIHFRLKSAQYRLCETSRSTKDQLVIPQYSTPSRPERLIDLYRQFLHDQEEGFACSMEADLMVAQMLVELASHRKPKIESKSVQRLAQQVKTTIDSDFCNPSLSPRTIADHLEVNQDYLGRVFKSVSGQSIGQSLNTRRLRESRKLLLESQLNINQIAQAVGYNDPGYFRRIFHKHFDMKPSDLRKLYYRTRINIS